MSLVHPPTGVLPAPQVRELPAAIPLRSMFGPGVILAGLSIGSGELVLWPRLTAEWGFSLFWACWIGVTIQFFLNMEIERYTLATGESAVTGFLRLSRAFGPVFLVCATVPWIWPGWALGAAELLTWELGGAPRPLAIGGLVLCGAILTLSPVVYRTVERLQMVLVAGIFAGVSWLAFQVVEAEHVAGLLRGAARVGHVPDGVDLPLLLGALAFAGAGGSVNLAQSNYVKDKGYGMGRWIGRLTSPVTGRAERESVVGAVFPDDAESRARWETWWRRTNLEHGLTFFLLCIVSLAIFCLLAAALLEPGGAVSPGLGFLADEARALGERFGPGARHIFLAAGIAVLFSTELALLDAVARVAADLVKASFFPARDTVTLSRLYFALLWLLIGFGVAVLLLGFDQPLVLLVLSAALNAVVMFLYAMLLLGLNLASFSGPLRPGRLRIAALVGAIGFFGFFSLLTIWDRVTG